MSNKNKELIERHFEINIVSTPGDHCPWVWRDGDNWRFVTDATSCKIAGIIEENEKLRALVEPAQWAVRLIADKMADEGRDPCNLDGWCALKDALAALPNVKDERDGWLARSMR